MPSGKSSSASYHYDSTNAAQELAISPLRPYLAGPRSSHRIELYRRYIDITQYTPATSMSNILVPPRNHHQRQQCTTDLDPLSHILASNRTWASHTARSDPSFFPASSKGQTPKILWIGCSDSRVPETTILGLKPGDVFVHRNIANILTPTDLSALSVIEYAVVYLKVQHIVVCGHTSCGGVAAALGNKKLGKIDTWLMPLRQLRARNKKAVDGCGSEAERSRMLVDLNVGHGVEMLRTNPDVVCAAKERGLMVHGLVYDLESGELKQLDVGGEEWDDEAFVLE